MSIQNYVMRCPRCDGVMVRTLITGTGTVFGGCLTCQYRLADNDEGLTKEEIAEFHGADLPYGDAEEQAWWEEYRALRRQFGLPPD
jgi:hypothetical protein